MAYFLVTLAALLLLFALLTTAAILRRRRQNPFAVHEKPVAMEHVWQQWTAAPGMDDAERARRNAVHAAVTPAHLDAVREDLVNFERNALAEPEPLLAIRRELMNSVDRRMMNREILALPDELKQRLRAQSGDVIASDEETIAYLAANELRLEVLREYAALRYGDRAPDDWFEVYEHASSLKQRTARNYISRSLSGELTEDNDARQQAISLVDSQLRAHLLRTAPGVRFESLARKE